MAVFLDDSLTAADRNLEFTIKNVDELPALVAIFGFAPGDVVALDRRPTTDSTLPESAFWHAVTDSAGNVELSTTRREVAIVSVGNYRLRIAGVVNAGFCYLSSPGRP